MTSSATPGPGGGRREGTHPPAGGGAHRVPWGGALLTALAAVGWAYLGMAVVAALALHLLGADTAGSLGPMTAALVTMAVGGRVSPSGDVSVFGISGAQATGTIDVLPLGVGLTGALLLAWVFLWSLRRAGPEVGLAELSVRALAVVVLFLAALAGLGWAGHDTVSLRGAGTGRGGSINGGFPGIGDLGDLGSFGSGLLKGLGTLARDHGTVGFRVDTGASMGGGVVWVVLVLAIALLSSRYGPLPRGWAALHRTVRPAASAMRSVLVMAVCAGLLVALYSAFTDDHPGRVVGGALAGAPNGVWLGAALGLFVSWHGAATGPLALLLPHPLDDVLRGANSGRAITMPELARYDGRVWLLTAAAAVMMLAAGVLAAARTPVGGASRCGYAGRCAVRLAVASGVALALLVWITGLSLDADLSVFGFDAVGSSVRLHGNPAWALLLGAGWGAVAGAVGALLAHGAGAAGSRAAPLAALGTEPVRRARPGGDPAARHAGRRGGA
ncbi:streptophobe family protein [Streptomyces sp. ICBB 8177]|uniref:streptophobe family protein n=1 Tax=Streptomyces sp. ICBB 8177 TaxID=563922 RepID=UPI0018EEA1D4|nr:streptophobe family protein [Streptomyces sp. ICBB 8177]